MGRPQKAVSALLCSLTCLMYLVSLGGSIGGIGFGQLDLDDVGGGRVHFIFSRLTIKVAGLAIPMLALALVHGEFDGVAVGAMEGLVDVEHRLHVVFAGGDLVEGSARIAERGAIEGDAAGAIDIRAEHLLRAEAFGKL